DMRLTYHVQNPLALDSSIDIALPPDTGHQKVIINDLQPKPQSLHLDADGNWMARYDLRAREQKEIVYDGTVQVFNGSIRSIEVPSETLASYLRPTEYWQSDHSDIKSLASQLQTPEAIYQYVVDTLDYDFTRVLPDADRLGAVQA